ncbi:MAG TPA: pilus assembly protein PilP [Gammaproteobacteria bacterium]|nr:pilus assembly protein PilP [Gammaproteobacteria bacterium]
MRCYRKGWRQVLGVVGLGLLLAACSGDKLDDLRQYVAAVKAKKGGRIEPIPEVAPFETFAYHTLGRKSPFEPWVTGVTKTTTEKKTSSTVRPDLDRRKEPLEAFALDTLKMVGTLEREGRRWAIVLAPDGLVYRVTQGNYLGQNHGRILSVNEDRVDLTEIVPDGLGGWQERRTKLALAE